MSATDTEGLVTCDNCDDLSEGGWGDSPLCVDCQLKEDPALVCEEHNLTRATADSPCPVCALDDDDDDDDDEEAP